jgi:hypothetical protein
MNNKLIELNPADTDHADVPAMQHLQQLSVRARQVLNLELQGLRKADISVRLGLHENYVGHIARTPSYVAARNALLDHHVHTMIRGLTPMAIRTLEEGFHSPNEYIRMAAAGMAFKILGFMHHGKECEAYANGGVTAEDICKQLLEKTNAARELTAVPEISPLAALGRISQSDEDPSRAKPNPSPGQPEGQPEGWPAAGASMRWPRTA